MQNLVFSSKEKTKEELVHLALLPNSSIKVSTRIQNQVLFCALSASQTNESQVTAESLLRNLRLLDVQVIKLLQFLVLNLALPTIWIGF